MSKTWAISGVDLHVEVTPTRVRAGLENALRDAVRSGRLPPGTRLPSSRQLAADLGLARNTIAEAYGQLVAEGWLAAQQGSGTRVAAQPTRTAPDPVVTSAGTGRSLRYDLRAGLPDLTAFPTTAWVTALRRALLAAEPGALGYSDPRGRPELRQALAGYLARARGVSAAPDQILICTGFTQALALLAQVLRARGATTVAMENYGHDAHGRVLTGHGLTTRAVPVDHRGARIDQLDADDAVLLTPAHQFPLGPSLHASRRAAVVGWARDTGGLVIEDDYDGEFRYDRHPVGAMQALGPDHVAYVGTASKTLAPGVRLGWLVATRAWLDDLTAAKAISDGQSSSLDQLALAQLIDSGGYDRHIRRRRHTYRRRRDQLNQALHQTATGTRVSGIAAGMHAVLTVPDQFDEVAALAAAARRGLALEGLTTYHRGGAAQPPGLVVGYGTPPDHAYSGALARLIAVLQRHR